LERVDNFLRPVEANVLSINADGRYALPSLSDSLVTLWRDMGYSKFRGQLNRSPTDNATLGDIILLMLATQNSGEWVHVGLPTMRNILRTASKWIERCILASLLIPPRRPADEQGHELRRRRLDTVSKLELLNRMQDAGPRNLGLQRKLCKAVVKATSWLKHPQILCSEYVAQAKRKLVDRGPHSQMAWDASNHSEASFK
jgi:hypothetical protein